MLLFGNTKLSNCLENTGWIVQNTNQHCIIYYKRITCLVLTIPYQCFQLLWSICIKFSNSFRWVYGNSPLPFSWISTSWNLLSVLHLALELEGFFLFCFVTFSSFAFPFPFSLQSCALRTYFWAQEDIFFKKLNSDFWFCIVIFHIDGEKSMC